MLLRAMALVRERVPAARLEIVGDGPLRAELERWRGPWRRSATTFHGILSGAQRDSILGAGTVFAMPSRIEQDGAGEGFGLVFVEAGAHGLPVVAGNSGGALDAVVDGKTGLLVDSEEPGSDRRALVELLRIAPSAQDRWAGPVGSTRRSLSWARASAERRDRLRARRPAMKVLFVNHTSQISGAERSLLELIDLAAGEGPTRVSPARPGDLMERARALGVHRRARPAGDRVRLEPAQALPRLGSGPVGSCGRSRPGAPASTSSTLPLRAPGCSTACCIFTRPRRVVDVRDVLPAGMPGNRRSIGAQAECGSDRLQLELHPRRFGSTCPAADAGLYPPVEVEAWLDLPLPSAIRRVPTHPRRDRPDHAVERPRRRNPCPCCRSGTVSGRKAATRWVSRVRGYLGVLE